MDEKKEAGSEEKLDEGKKSKQRKKPEVIFEVDEGSHEKSTISEDSDNVSSHSSYESLKSPLEQVVDDNKKKPKDDIQLKLKIEDDKLLKINVSNEDKALVKKDDDNLVQDEVK